ncbi:MAG: DUF4421 family protein [Cyclobacteriaceae bacterium]
MLSPVGARAQDQSYVDVYQDTMNLKLLVTNRGLSTGLRSMENDARMRFSPDNRSYLGVGGYIWNLGFQLHLPLPISWFFDEGIAQESGIFDFQATLYQKKWLFDGIYQSYRNLYPANVTSLDTEIQNDDIDARRMLVTATYLLTGNRISVRAPYNRNLRQLRSAGSWMFTFGFASLELQGQTSVVPSGLRRDFASDTLFSDLRGISLIARPGYMYNYVAGHFFFHATASVGLALQHKFYRREEIRSQAWGLAPVYNFRAALGYDNGSYFAGISGIYYHTYMQADHLRMLESARNLQLFIGYRFAEADWLRRLKPSILEW